MILEILLFFLILFIAYFIWWRRQIFKLRDQLGLKGPKVNFITGNFGDIRNSPYVDEPMKILSDWRKVYGDVYGYYFGPKLNIYTTDIEMVKDVLIRRFDCFVDRMVFALDEPSPNCFSLINLKGDHWKQVRKVITPTFTASKMKQMSYIINEKLDTLMQKMQEHADNGDSFDIYKDFQALTLDVIGQCAFALNVNCQTNSEDPFLMYVQEVFRLFDIKNFPLVGIAATFPELRWLFSKLQLFTRLHTVENVLISNLKKVVLERKKNFQTNQSVDVLQLLLEQQRTTEKDESSKWKLTDDAIIGNAYIFLLAGFETTSTALAFTAWLLAKHQNVQKKLQDEIDAHLQKFPDMKEQEIVNYSFVNNLPYMDAVFHESTRLLPPVIHFVQRLCVKDCQIGNLFVPKGVQIHIPVMDIHMNADLWPEPEKFDPERFMGNDKYSTVSWLPFGAGPRNCVGMRFADMEYKMALVRLLSKFTLSLTKNSEDPLKLEENTLLMRPKNGVTIMLKKRY